MRSLRVHNNEFAEQPRILIVDDDRLGTQLRTATLRLSGFCVEVATSGFEALSKAEDQQFDVFVVDYDMPKMNGLELATLLRSQGHCGAIVMLSGRLDPPNEPGTEFLAEFISKGQGPEVLLQVLARLAPHCGAETPPRRNENLFAISP